VTERVSAADGTARYVCDCQARVHKLISNCLSCGRVICELEGPGKCVFCDSFVESKEQQLQQYHEEKSKKEKVKAHTPKADYSTFVGGQPTLRGRPAAQFPVLESEDAAIERKNRLLSYDQDEVSRFVIDHFFLYTNNRSRVHDESGDFDYKEKVADKWLTVEERATAHNV
jgi:hypothetical protein